MCMYMYVCIYRVSQEERTIFWEVIVSVVLSKKLYMNMCPIPKGFRDRAILVVWLGRPVLSFPPALLRERRSIFLEVIVSVILSKKLYKNVCPIPNGFRDRAIWLYSSLAWAPSIVFPLALLVNILHKGTSRRTQTNNTPCPHTSCKVHWCWRRNFRTFIINCTSSVTLTINTGIRNST
jgi:hypothetical protein